MPVKLTFREVTHSIGRVVCILLTMLLASWRHHYLVPGPRLGEFLATLEFTPLRQSGVLGAIYFFYLEMLSSLLGDLTKRHGRVVVVLRECCKHVEIESTVPSGCKLLLEP